MSDALLEIKDLTVSFPLAEGVVRAVEGLNLTISRGEVLGVVGESGCGKTVAAQSVASHLKKLVREHRVREHPQGSAPSRWELV